MKSPHISPPISPNSFSNPKSHRSSTRNRNASSLSISIPISPQKIPPLESATYRRSSGASSFPEYSSGCTGTSSTSTDTCSGAGSGAGSNITPNVVYLDSDSNSIYRASSSSSSTTTTTTLHYQQFPQFSSGSSLPNIGSTEPQNSNSYYYYQQPLKTSTNTNFEVMPAENPYPNGPVLVREPNIYLYSEPSIQTASQFDVIVNVAREVPNPFEQTSRLSKEISSPMAPPPPAPFVKGARSSSSSSSSFTSNLSCSPLSSTSTHTEDTCFSPTGYPENSPPSSVNSTPNLNEELSSENDCEEETDEMTLRDLSSPITQSSTTAAFGLASSESLNGRTTPEYIYVPWDHTSKLTPDLARLTDLISSRSAEGKKILVHCQCGVSRSASLVVAYVMRQDKCDLNTAYDHVKKRSPNISPNMTLMFQLIDWARMLKRNPENPGVSTSLGPSLSSPPSSYDDDLIPSASGYSLASPPPSTPTTAVNH
ncbi:tyrosine/serine/threonine protein phosphatase MSG5 [Sugiyamaella lignohabitans]|uniref:protein-tyrosine-phosphatase n=1 Tax=Sugiyamaella lignohabitans TaxID=796027 RepID=A0A161HIF9_9ASCO|nr:tyrosine/serine/threonine protein phosphatase MSG5 [Sugiyamaella lignohabitans]ANB10918.1 tyrosine/serine/threonine protein phosphatase MSG5 [Sugiyamaella lignohabitans]